ncbi:NAD(P)H-dependent oxidoreductase [Christiangramia fulva]|uniref:NAD(P)H-dependent oxidoreductase n=1 Tax=Christiangramia fulva TaxID=2126553 RepID=A0A2R3Z159_9FLAO|nr:NAD(P)H-dependent oxidoreductase [Christiangramia fulva]AVR44007.1 NAD(P)H-dependent oxidoreductase [Christiangramia fulva]
MNLEVKNKSAYIENLYWRYATKKFNTAKEVQEKDFEKILESLQLSASSYGLQPYEIFVIKDQETREKLRTAAWNQSQITDSSYLIVFANYSKIEESHIDNYLDNIAKTRKKSREDLAGMEKMLKNTILAMSAEEQQIWASKQTYIALGNLLSATANFRIDACPMEGFDNKLFDEILGLDKMNLTSSVIATIGYRSEDDLLQYQEKVRKNRADLFHFI